MPKSEPWRWWNLVDLPDMVSWLGLALGLGALYMGVIHHAWGVAFGLLFSSAVADLLDGYVARKTGRARPFGGYFDCMVDTVVFLPVVSILVYQSGMQVLSLHLVFITCGVLRHARLLTHPNIKRLGIPSTVAGFAFPLAYFLHRPLGFSWWLTLFVIMIVMSLGMVSLVDLRYPRVHSGGETTP